MEYRRDPRHAIPFRRSILTRFTILMCLFVILSTVGTGLLVFESANIRLRAAIGQRNEQVAERAAAEVGIFFQVAAGGLREIALLLPLGGRDRQSVSVLLEKLSLELPHFRRLALVHRAYGVLADNALGRTTLSDFDSQAVDAVLQGRAETWKPRLIQRELPVMTLVEPVDWSGTGDEYLLAEVDLRRVWDIVDGVLIGEHGFAYLSSAEGGLVAHPDKGLILRSAGAPVPAIPGFRVSRRIPDPGWTVTVVQPEREAFLPVRSMLVLSILGMAFFTVLCSLTGIYFIRRASRPVQSLLDATEALGAGDMERRAEIASQDEFGAIARSFNGMAGSLKARTEELEESEARLRMITESVTDVIFSLDSRGCFTFVTSRIEAITGFPPGELLGSFFADLLAPGDAGRMIGPFLRSLSRDHQESVTAQPYLLTKSGGMVCFETEIVKLVEPDGTMLFHGVGRDITERRGIEEKARRNERLSLLGELAAGVAHELRNSMSGILGFSRTLRSSPYLTDEAVHDLERIRKEADHARQLLQNLLSFGRVVAPVPAPCSWNGILEDALDACSYEMEESDLATRRNLDPGIPEVRVDAAQMRDVFINLIRNAEQAIRGTGRKGTILVETGHQDTRVFAVVTDSGPGIPRTDLPRVFDPFYTTKSGGSGLGLPVSMRIVHAHGGEIHVENRDGWGASFKVELPLHTRTAADAPEDPNVQLRSGAAGDSPGLASKETPDLRGCRIILAEDEDSIREYVGRFLTRMGCEVLATVNGRETVTALSGQGRFDLILSDLRMPGMDGEELYAWVLANKPELLKRMIFLTGDLDDPRSRGFISYTGVTCLEKPIVTSELARLIADAMRHSGPVGG